MNERMPSPAKGPLKRLVENPFAPMAVAAGMLLAHEKPVASESEVPAPAALMPARELGTEPITAQSLEKQWKDLRGTVYLHSGNELDAKDIATARAFADTHDVSELVVYQPSLGDGAVLLDLLRMRVGKVACSFLDEEAKEMADQVHNARLRQEHESQERQMSEQRFPEFELQTPWASAEEMTSILHEARFLPDVTFWSKFPISVDHLKALAEAGKDVPLKVSLFTDGYHDADGTGLFMDWEKNQPTLTHQGDPATSIEKSRFINAASNALQPHVPERTLAFDPELHRLLVAFDPSWSKRKDILPIAE